jgi:hypothetical protein
MNFFPREILFSSLLLLNFSTFCEEIILSSPSPDNADQLIQWQFKPIPIVGGKELEEFQDLSFSLDKLNPSPEEKVNDLSLTSKFFIKHIPGFPELPFTYSFRIILTENFYSLKEKEPFRRALPNFEKQFFHPFNCNMNIGSRLSPGHSAINSSSKNTFINYFCILLELKDIKKASFSEMLEYRKNECAKFIKFFYQYKELPNCIIDLLVSKNIIIDFCLPRIFPPLNNREVLSANPTSRSICSISNSSFQQNNNLIEEIVKISPSLLSLSVPIDQQYYFSNLFSRKEFYLSPEIEEKYKLPPLLELKD